MNGSSQPVTAYQYAKSTYAQPEPHSFIKVKNLSTQGLVGGDPWGREAFRRNIFQPILLSASLSLKEPFSSASSTDTVNASTVNYSSLSKEILKVIASRQPLVKPKDDWSLNDLLEWLSVYLTGKLPGGARGDRIAASYQLEGGCPCLESDWKYKPPMLNVKDLQELELSVLVPKGGLVSEGISLTKTFSFMEGSGVQTAPHSSVLRIQNMRVPTLIGVNDNERTARQIVVASLEISPYVCHGRDWYNELEELAFKTIEESSFETLESLAQHITDRIIRRWSYFHTPKGIYSQVRITLEKPSAVTFADAPAIEIVRSSDPSSDNNTKGMYDEWLLYSGEENMVPFPLKGRLDDFLGEGEDD